MSSDGRGGSFIQIARSTRSTKIGQGDLEGESPNSVIDLQFLDDRESVVQVLGDFKLQGQQEDGKPIHPNVLDDEHRKEHRQGHRQYRHVGRLRCIQRKRNHGADSGPGADREHGSAQKRGRLGFHVGYAGNEAGRFGCGRWKSIRATIGRRSSRLQPEGALPSFMTWMDWLRTMPSILVDFR